MVPYCSGGAERRVHELARRLGIRHDVHMVTWRWWGDDPILIEDGITYHGVGEPRSFYGADGRRRVSEQLAFALRVPAALARIHPDVVDVSATPYLPVYMAWLGTRLTRTPLVATWHEYWGEHWHDYLDDRRLVAALARLAEAVARPLADRRIVVSPFTSRRLVGDAPTRARRGWRSTVDVVPNGVDLAALAGSGSADPATRPIDVVFVGRLIAEKRVDLLIRAVATVARDRPGVRCLVIGDGPERDALLALTDELGVAANVRLAGRLPQEDLPGRLGAARILALPSAREGYGIAVVEGQAAGAVPVVAQSPLSAAPDLVQHGVDGLVVEGTVEAMASAIADLLDHPQSVARLSAAARSTAAGRGWDARAADVERVYVDLVATRRARRFRILERGSATEARSWGAGT
jgi:L-malate glycosyltransferase